MRVVDGRHPRVVFDALHDLGAVVGAHLLDKVAHVTRWRQLRGEHGTTGVLTVCRPRVLAAPFAELQPKGTCPDVRVWGENTSVVFKCFNCFRTEEKRQSHPTIQLNFRIPWQKIN